MHEILVYLGEILAAIIGFVTISRLLFYTKAETDKLLGGVQKELEDKHTNIQDKINENQQAIKDSLSEIKDTLFEKLLETERLTGQSRQEFQDRLLQNRQQTEEYHKNLLQSIAQINADTKELSNNFLQAINVVKDELKNDYVNRYNDLLQLLNTKVNTADFDRLEHKFDRICESITELKTIVQIQREDSRKKESK